MADRLEWEWMAFGAHPDDVEIGAGGWLARQARAGQNVLICDLTAAEKSSNGDPVTRRREALAAAEVLGAKERICLSFPDRGLTKTEEKIARIVDVLRSYRPRYVLCPWHQDSHPDHRQAADLVREGVINARLRRYGQGEAWAVCRVWEYFINETADHPVYVPLGAEDAERKQAALACYVSQFVSGGDAVPTRLHALIRQIGRRDGYFGGLIGAEGAEGFFQREEIAVRGLQDLDLT